MNNFMSPLIVKQIDDKFWEIQEPFLYYLKDKNGETITVPKYFKTDFASVPKIFWSLIGPIGRHVRASVIHDFLYHTKTYPRKDCDIIFKQAMKVSGVNWFIRGIIYNAVRLCGANSYKK